MSRRIRREGTLRRCKEGIGVMSMLTWSAEAAVDEVEPTPAPVVPEGLWESAKYPYTESPPHRSEGYPGQAVVQPVVVLSGA